MTTPEAEPTIEGVIYLPMMRIDLREDGLLWLINTTVFHPRGFALALADDGTLHLQGDGTNPWYFNVDEDMHQGLFDSAAAAFRHAAEHNSLASGE